MRVVTRHRPAQPEEFAEQVQQALHVLRGQVGFRSGELGRSPDDPAQYLLTTRWLDVGSMRRGLGSYAAKVALAPVLVCATDEVSVFEVLLEVTDTSVRHSGTARAPGQAARGAQDG